ncbi:MULTISPECIES: hypothetical protein [Helicobacter]|nr:hypothetical protein [Helicobacter sp. UBA3407]
MCALFKDSTCALVRDSLSFRYCEIPQGIAAIYNSNIFMIL